MNHAQEITGIFGDHTGMKDSGDLIEWQDDQGAALPHEVVCARHHLPETGLFTDEHLVKVFDTHDPEYLLVYQMGGDHTKLYDFRRGERGTLSSTQFLDAVKDGSIWLNILRMQDFHPEFDELINALYDELERKTPGFKARFRSSNLLVSSPRAQVYFHADAPLNMLWHVRGQKRAFVYPPNDERFAPREHVELIFTRESDDALPYEPSFDQFETRYDLNPGDMITWPQNTPHRVENVEGLNVSLSTEHYTPEGILKCNTYLANYYLRRWLHLPTRSTRIHGFIPALKRAAFYACRRLPLEAAKEFEDSPQFKLKTDKD